MLQHYLKNSLKLSALCGLLGLGLSQTAQAEGKLTIYCSVQNTTCEKITQAFGKKYGVETQFVRNSTGIVLGKIKAEKDNPQADVWYGGTIEPHLQAGDLGLLAKYRSPMQKEIMPKFKALIQRKLQSLALPHQNVLLISLSRNSKIKFNMRILAYPERAILC